MAKIVIYWQNVAMFGSDFFILSKRKTTDLLAKCL
nr:MAG TPA: hypothetical protein [Caudoviricetes sp.]